MLDKKQNRLWGLDLFRVFSAIVIFVFHTRNMNVDYKSLDPFVAMGAVFMTGFFMLSGFVLYHSYSDMELSSTQDIITFYVKRICSIVPIYYFVAILFILIFKTGNLQSEIVLLPIELLGIQTWFTSLFTWSHNGGTWFLSVLFLCYFIFPLILNIIKNISRKKREIILIILFLLLAYCPLIKMIFDCSSLYTNPLYRLLEFICGMLLYSLWKEGRLARGGVKAKKIMVVLILIVLFIIQCFLTILFGMPHDYTFYNVFFAPFFAAVIYFLAGLQKNEGIKRKRVLSYMSEITYCFYLAQLFTYHLADYISDICKIDSIILKIVIAFMICVSLAIVGHEFVEKPAKKYFFSKSKGFGTEKR